MERKIEMRLLEKLYIYVHNIHVDSLSIKTTKISMRRVAQNSETNERGRGGPGKDPEDRANKSAQSGLAGAVTGRGS